MIKLLLSAYIIVVLPYFTTTYTLEFIINNGFIANSDGLTSGQHAIYLAFVVFIIEQFAATAITERLLWKKY